MRPPNETPPENLAMAHQWMFAGVSPPESLPCVRTKNPPAATPPRQIRREPFSLSACLWSLERLVQSFLF